MLWRRAGHDVLLLMCLAGLAAFAGQHVAMLCSFSASRVAFIMLADIQVLQKGAHVPEWRVQGAVRAMLYLSFCCCKC